MKSFSILTLILFYFTSPAAQALSVNDYFTQINQQTKGPFGLNYLQGPGHRVAVNDGTYPSTILFQAAYRNDLALGLARDHDVYLGNLFTTNYYELMGEYVFGDARSNHPLDIQGLINQGPASLPKANAMLQNWVLEKYYVNKFPSSKLAKAFALRGISGSEFEVAYAKHFFHYYASSITDEFQFLPLMLLLQNSPVTDSPSLEKARNLISQSYDYFLARWGASDARVSRLFQIRNAIHNQLSPSIVEMINRYVTDFPYYQAEKHTYLFIIQDLLTEYYRIDPRKITVAAQLLNLQEIASFAEQIEAEGPQLIFLAQLSQHVAQLKSNLMKHQLDVKNKSEALVLLNESVQFISKELGKVESVDSPVFFEIALDLMYAEGFLIEDNWSYFLGEIRASGSTSSAASLMGDIILVTTETLRQSLEPSLNKWISVESQMAQVIDDKLKSSTVNTAALLAQKVKR